MKPSWRPRGSRTRRRERSRDSESFRRRQLIDKPKLTHSEPREPSRRVRDKPGREKDSSTRRG